jgi:hypothetical protein
MDLCYQPRSQTINAVSLTRSETWFKRSSEDIFFVERCARLGVLFVTAIFRVTATSPKLALTYLTDPGSEFPCVTEANF